MASIVAGWDSEAELPVDGQVGSGPSSGSGGKVEGAKAGGPGLYMIEPSGLYWVSSARLVCNSWMITLTRCRVITELPPARDDKRQRQSWRSLI